MEAGLEYNSSYIAVRENISMTASDDEVMLTTDEVAKQLRVNVKTVRHWIQTGELVAMDIGNEYRISKGNLRRFIEKRQTDKRKK